MRLARASRDGVLMYDACVLEGATFDGFVHVDNWVPQRFVTATGPDPLPR